MMFRFSKMSPNYGSANAVQLTSFNHINGDSSSTSQENPSSGVQPTRPAIQGSSKAEILGPTGTVRGYKNIIRERKEVLRLSFVGETLEVRLRNSYESKQIRLLLIIYANSLIYHPCDKKHQACDISDDVDFILIFTYRKAKRARSLCTPLQWEGFDQKWKSVHTSGNYLTIWDLKWTSEIYLCTKTIKANLTCDWQSKTLPFLMYL